MTGEQAEKCSGPRPDGLEALGAGRANLSVPALVEHALAAGEVRLGRGGTLVVATGRFTGRSPEDKHIVASAGTRDSVWWEANAAMSPEAFAALRADMTAHLAGLPRYVQDLDAGADPEHRVGVRVIAERAWHALFIRHLLRRPAAAALSAFHADLTIVDSPSFAADPGRHGCRSETVIALDLEAGVILIGGTDYAGEIKKAVFTALNYLLPERGVMPMHCAANHAPGDAGDTALFFGLSGTGKTTLSADPGRVLIGDDEHGWSERGVFNIEGGCYAKTLGLSAADEPEIFAAAQGFAAVLENVVVDPETRSPDFADDRLTANTRCAYPLEDISNASESGLAGHPTTIVMLTCDAFGVLPPIARLSPAQAMYHFLSGFTAKIAGTERGVTEPQPTFSTCFGAPFLPRRPEVYGALLRERIARHGTACWLVNTGWTGGPYGEGRRMPIKATRALIDAALSGALDRAETRTDPHFAFEVPRSAPGVDDSLLDPRGTWADAAAYDRRAAELVAMFAANFASYRAHVDAEVRAVALG